MSKDSKQTKPTPQTKTAPQAPQQKPAAPRAEPRHPSQEHSRVVPGKREGSVPLRDRPPGQPRYDGGDTVNFQSPNEGQPPSPPPKGPSKP
jgi:hypothetical protein